MSGKLRKKQNRILLLVAIFGILIYTTALVLSLLPREPVIEEEISSSEPSSQPPVFNTQQQSIAPLSDEELFTDSAFIGNSCVERLFVQGYALQSDFLSGVGLTVHSAFTEAPARLDQPITQQLEGEKKYTRIFVLFGINEVGNDPGQFIAQYGLLIDHMKTHQPQAQIYIQSILPVTRAAHERNVYLVNNDNISLFNGLIRDLAEQKQVHFLNIYEALVNEEGFLPDDASTDGIHLSKNYNQIWINYMKEHVR